jgi:hypothetical protein
MCGCPLAYGMGRGRVNRVSDVTPSFLAYIEKRAAASILAMGHHLHHTASNPHAAQHLPAEPVQAPGSRLQYHGQLSRCFTPSPQAAQPQGRKHNQQTTLHLHAAAQIAPPHAARQLPCLLFIIAKIEGPSESAPLPAPSSLASSAPIASNCASFAAKSAGRPSRAISDSISASAYMQTGMSDSGSLWHSGVEAKQCGLAAWPTRSRLGCFPHLYIALKHIKQVLTCYINFGG